MKNYLILFSLITLLCGLANFFAATYMAVCKPNLPENIAWLVVLTFISWIVSLLAIMFAIYLTDRKPCQEKSDQAEH